jgi:tripartite-type tricarboxylate transporter receptor subunit TctC
MAKGVPGEVRARLATACAEVAQSPQLRASFDRLGTELTYYDSAAFAARLADDFKRKGDAVRAMELQIE